MSKFINIQSRFFTTYKKSSNIKKFINFNELFSTIHFVFFHKLISKSLPNPPLFSSFSFLLSYLSEDLFILWKHSFFFSRKFLYVKTIAQPLKSWTHSFSLLLWWLGKHGSGWYGSLPLKHVFLFSFFYKKTRFSLQDKIVGLKYENTAAYSLLLLWITPCLYSIIWLALSVTVYFLYYEPPNVTCISVTVYFLNYHNNYLTCISVTYQFKKVT